LISHSQLGCENLTCQCFFSLFSLVSLNNYRKQNDFQNPENWS
jgi:hypothetical protein